MTRLCTLFILPAAFGFIALAAHAVHAAPKIIHIDDHGNVEEHYLGSGDQAALAGKRASADIQDGGLPVIVRGPGRSKPASKEPALIVRQIVTHPHYRAPIVPTLTRPLVQRPVVVRPQIVRAGTYRYRRRPGTGPTVIFNGDHSRYDDVNINIERY
ncbi:hypothetical protein [Notoacmeibacter sp. MSK16QG-6]|uniref:hypothetical protein n=1 Tax=Notoacmeibacter sp. MSK16QG-6 TaxID=2957982 RepID=UPI00209CA22F|nr:hypothetical protein [Notoacmeibacter sp. MSK16QG-6]MCP1199198.1 hypothetical protein [Notoacmeibacter sp. MSK16QG-6]